jgi:glycosyltransferase involved in cell wall biosynthesis
MKKKLNLGFIINFSHLRWLGGSNYFSNLFDAIRIYTNHSIFIFTGIEKKKFHPEIKNRYKIIYLKILDPKIKINIFINYLRFFLLIFFKRDFILESKLKKYKINILSHSQPLGKKSSIKSIYWIPDLQEIVLKEFFSLKIRLRRWFNNFLAINNSSIILFSSDAVKLLFKSKYSFPNIKLKVLQFPTKLPNKVYFQKDMKRFKKFFLISNQFWLHKNYEIILKALIELKNNNLFPVILCTGSNQDWRSNIYFKNLINDVKRNKLSNFIVLGNISRDKQMYLMQNCIALINPSKSEGWNTAIEEAKSFNKNIIASNLKVHLEQVKKKNNLFNPDDHIKLSKLLKKFFLKKENINKNSYKSLLIKNDINFKKFGLNYEKIIQELI